MIPSHSLSGNPILAAGHTHPSWFPEVWRVSGEFSFLSSPHSVSSPQLTTSNWSAVDFHISASSPDLPPTLQSQGICPWVSPGDLNDHVSLKVPLPSLPGAPKSPFPLLALPQDQGCCDSQTPKLPNWSVSHANCFQLFRQALQTQPPKSLCCLLSSQPPLPPI